MVALLIAATACGAEGEPEGGGETTTTAVPSLDDIRVASDALELDTLRVQGAVEDLGDELDPLLDGIHDELTSVFVERFAALDRSGGAGRALPLGPTGINAGSGLYLEAVQASTALGSAMGLTQQGPVSIDKSGIKVEGTPTEVSYTERSTAKRGSASATTGSKVHAKPCPDADGKATARIEVFADLTIQGRGGVYGSHVELTLELETRADDDAKFAGHDFEIVAEAVDFAEGGGASSEALATVRFDSQTATPTVIGSSGRADEAYQGNIRELVRAFGAGAAVSASQEMERAWQSGRCVDLQISTDPSKRTGLAPDTEVSISAKPRSKVDGAPTGGTVTARLASGTASVSPEGSKQRADATFTYVSPPERDKRGSVQLEARSKRGVGRATAEFDTKQRAFRIEGEIEGISGSGTKCDGVEGDWKLTLTGGSAGITVTMEVTATLDAAGKGTASIPYTWGGAASGGGSASGPARLELSEDERSGTLVLGPLEADASGSLNGQGIGGSAGGTYRFPVTGLDPDSC